MPGSIGALTRDIYLMPLASDQPISPDDPQPISSSSLYVPGFLLDYYNRRAAIAIAAEIRGVELIVGAVNTNGDFIPNGLVIGALSNGDPTTIIRQTSQPTDISSYLRAAQDVVFSVYGRQLPQDPPSDLSPIARYVTLLLLLGDWSTV